jgi:hypothetical protein
MVLLIKNLAMSGEGRRTKIVKTKIILCLALVLPQTKSTPLTKNNYEKTNYGRNRANGALIDVCNVATMAGKTAD